MISAVCRARFTSEQWISEILIGFGVSFGLLWKVECAHLAVQKTSENEKQTREKHTGTKRKMTNRCARP